jgi:F-type H+-transporting ATPase subunit delta
MPRVSVVAKNYARALFIAARKSNSIDSTSSELAVFKQNFSTSFANELKNPVIAKNDLARIIDEVTKKFSLGKLTSNFFASIVRNRRLNLFPEIYEEYNRLVKTYKNILEVEMISAVKADQKQIEKVRTLIEKRYPGKKIAIRETVKEKILGGFQIRIGSEIIDASLKNQIANISKQCLNVVG